jgi:tetratricopeptide (TPR) repeat protein
LWLLAIISGCSELRARSYAREGNEHYRAGSYAQAARAYEQAEKLDPDLAPIVLNKGLACRQLMMPGAKSESAARATECALAAFKRLQSVRPDDPRGEQLYVQTLFDAERYEELANMYLQQLARAPADPLALNGIIQVYTRWGRPDEALRWMAARADRRPKDAEAQYAVGVYIFSMLLERGGGADKASYDPRPGLSRPEQRPLFSLGDIVGAQRVDLATRGVTYLERALALRPSYRDALVYLNLLHRQKSFAYFDQPQAWEAEVQSAEKFRNRAAAVASSAHPAADAVRGAR